MTDNIKIFKEKIRSGVVNLFYFILFMVLWLVALTLNWNILLSNILFIGWLGFISLFFYRIYDAYLYIKTNKDYFIKSQTYNKQNSYYDYKKILEDEVRIRLKNQKINSYAKLLEIDLNIDNEETIKKKYRKLALKWNPDKFVNDIKENQDISYRNFKLLNNAYNEIKKYKGIK